MRKNAIHRLKTWRELGPKMEEILNVKKRQLKARTKAAKLAETRAQAAQAKAARLELDLGLERFSHGMLKEDCRPWRDNYPIIKKGLRQAQNELEALKTKYKLKVDVPLAGFEHPPT